MRKVLRLPSLGAGTANRHLLLHELRWCGTEPARDHRRRLRCLPRQPLLSGRCSGALWRLPILGVPRPVMSVASMLCPVFRVLGSGLPPLPGCKPHGVATIVRCAVITPALPARARSRSRGMPDVRPDRLRRLPDRRYLPGLRATQPDIRSPGRRTSGGPGAHGRHRIHRFRCRRDCHPDQPRRVLRNKRSSAMDLSTGGSPSAERQSTTTTGCGCRQVLPSRNRCCRCWRRPSRKFRLMAPSSGGVGSFVPALLVCVDASGQRHGHGANGQQSDLAGHRGVSSAPAGPAACQHRPERTLADPPFDVEVGRRAAEHPLGAIRTRHRDHIGRSPRGDHRAVGRPEALARWEPTERPLDLDRR